MGDFAVMAIVGLVLLGLYLFSLLMQSRDRRSQLERSMEARQQLAERERQFEGLQLRAQSGEVAAQAELGKFLSRGSRHTAEARKWLEMAAFRGHAEAQYEFARMLLFTKGVTQDTEMALSWLSKAAAQGMVEAELLTGQTLLREPRNWRKAAGHFEAAERKGSIEARLGLAKLLKVGSGVPQDYMRSIELLQTLATERVFQKNHEVYHGASELLLELKRLLPCHVIDEIKPISRRWNANTTTDTLLQLAAMEGDVVAQYLLGNYSSLNLDAKCETWYSQAAAQGYASAQYELAERLRDGKLIPTDLPRAKKLLTDAALQGYSLAQEQLGLMLLLGQGGAPNAKDACFWLTLAAPQKGDGRAVLKNLKETLPATDLQAVEQAAKDFKPKQNPLSSSGRVEIYYFERSTPELARLRLEADGGVIESQFQLGRCYYEHPRLLGRNALAYIWFNLAAAGGHITAKQLRDAVGASLEKRALLLAQMLCRQKIPALNLTSN